jgi:hypothetical protein
VTANFPDPAEFPSDDELNREVARRLDLISNRPDLMMRYDANGDGVLDRQEWEVVRSLVRRQVVEELHEARSSRVEAEQPLAASAGADSSSTEPVTEPRADANDWAGIDTDPHIDLTVREQLGQRFQLLHELGEGAQGNTYLGRDLESNLFVAIKELAVSRLDDWKSLELFEREQTVLSRLEHPAIPGFVDAIEAERDGRPRLFLVQEFVEGETLDAELEHSGHFSPAELRDLAEQLLDVLIYLQSLDPPVIHRDIKPANIIRRPNGEVALVDFGGVQFERAEGTGGSTVVGTTGYMPPEQLLGRGSASTDLYALGATLIHLATGHHPGNLPVSRSKLQWRQFSSLPDELAGFIDRLVEPISDDRFQDAAAARRALSVAEPVPAVQGAVVAPVDDWAKVAAGIEPSRALWRRPANSFVALERSTSELTVRVPGRVNVENAAIGVGTFVLAYVVMNPLGGWFTSVIVIGLVLWGMVSLFRAHSSYVLEATPGSWRVVERYWGIPFESQGSSEGLRGARVERTENRTRYGTRVVYTLQLQVDDFWNDIDVRLAKDEKDWLAAEINAFASDARRVRLAHEASVRQLSSNDSAHSP